MLSKQSWNQMLLHGHKTALACTGICVMNVKDKEAALAAGEQHYNNPEEHVSYEKSHFPQLVR